MPFVADLHIHSYLSRATSPTLDLEHIHAWAQRKGIAVVATGDFTHPRWFDKLLARAGNELRVLTEWPVEDAERDGPPLFGEALRRMRAGEVKRIAGFDGEYGIVRVFDEEERKQLLPGSTR